MLPRKTLAILDFDFAEKMENVRRKTTSAGTHREVQKHFKKTANALHLDLTQRAVLMSQTVAMSPRVEKFSTDIFRCIVVFPCTYLMLLKVCCFVCSGSRISHLGEVNAKT